jgi:hypothetical protein
MRDHKKAVQQHQESCAAQSLTNRGEPSAIPVRVFTQMYPILLCRDDARLRRIAESRRDREEAVQQHREIRAAEVVTTRRQEEHEKEEQRRAEQEEEEDEEKIEERRQRIRERALQRREEEEVLPQEEEVGILMIPV